MKQWHPATYCTRCRGLWSVSLPGASEEWKNHGAHLQTAGGRRRWSRGGGFDQRGCWSDPTSFERPKSGLFLLWWNMFNPPKMGQVIPNFPKSWTKTWKQPTTKKSLSTIGMFFWGHQFWNCQRIRCVQVTLKSPELGTYPYTVNWRATPAVGTQGFGQPLVLQKKTALCCGFI